MKKSVERRVAILGIILANIIMGAAPPIFKWAFENIHLYTFIFLRNAIAAIICILLFRNHMKLKKKDFFMMFLLSFFGITLNLYFTFVGLQNTQSINVSIIGSSAPIFFVLGSLLFFREKPGIKGIIGNIIGFLGVMIIVLEPLFNGVHIDRSFGGNIYLVLGTFALVIYMLLAKELTNKYRTITILPWYFLFGSISFFPAFVFEVGQYGFLPHINEQGIIGLLFGAFGVSLLGYSLLTWGLKHIKSSEVSVFTYIDPVITILIAIPLLQEIPSPTFIFGAFLIFFGIYVAENRLHWHPFHKLFGR